MKEGTSLHPHYIEGLPLMSFRASLDAKIAALLDEIASTPEYVGSSNASIMSLLYTLIYTCRLRNVLQLGTYVGFSALVMGDALKKVDGRLITVDPDERVNRIAQDYIRRADLQRVVVFQEGSSIDTVTLAFLSREAPFDLIYIDSLHNYDHAKQELALYWPMLRPSGYLCLDDASKAAVAFDTSDQGGVYRAVEEWLPTVSDCEWILTREPSWPHQYGCFLATKVPPGEGLVQGALKETLACLRLVRQDLEQQVSKLRLADELRSDLAERDKALAERDAALREQDALLAQREQALQALRQDLEAIRRSTGYRLLESYRRAVRWLFPMDSLWGLPYRMLLKGLRAILNRKSSIGGGISQE